MTVNFDKEYQKLNPSQKIAVDTIDGPVLVIAGPGTGKTQVLSLRIANILKNTDTDPASIICLTFQEASVTAMKERLFRFIGQDAYKVGIYTFHSFCTEVIQKFPNLFELPEQVKVLSDVDKIKIFKEIIIKENLNNIQFRNDVLGYFKSLASSISTLKKEFINPKELKQISEYLYESLDEKAKNREEFRFKKLSEVAIFYEKYLEVTKELGLIDFDDMIFKVTEGFKTNDALVKLYQEKYLYTLVDEFQDTNSSQLEVIKSIANFEGLSSNVFAVGDDDQTIFRFQGASSENFDRFLNIFPETEIIVLDTNYRSTQSIIDGADNVITENPGRLSDSDFFKQKDLNKKFKAHTKGEKQDIEIHEFEHSFHEDYWIANEISNKIEKGILAKDIAIITRNNAQIKNLTKVLDMFEIPYQVKRNESLFTSKSIKEVISLLEVLSDPGLLQNDSKMWNVFALNFWERDSLTIFQIYSKAKQNKKSLINEILEGQDEGLRLLAKKLIDIQLIAETENFENLFSYVVQKFDLIQYFEKLPNSFAELNKLSSLFQFIQSRSKFNPNYKLKDFLEEVTIMQERGIAVNEDKVDIHADAKVNIITAHGAKGLEFEFVFIYQCSENKWEKNRGAIELIKLPPLALKQHLDSAEVPQELINENNDDEIDERRLFYVAMTRAKKKLYLNYSKHYYNSDTGEVDNEEKLVSKFVLETKIEDIQSHKDLLEKHTDIVKILIEESKPIVIQNESREYLKNLINSKLSLSASKLNKYDSCNYKFLLEDVFGLPSPKNINMIIGTIIHNSIEKFYYSLKDLKTITDFELQKVQDYAVRLLKEEIQNIPQDDSYSIDKAIIDIQKILEIYFDYLRNQKIKPKDIEKVIYLNYQGIKLSGRIDLILENDFGLTLIDFKTSQNIPTITDFLGLTKNSDKSHLRQLLFYKLLTEESRYSSKKIESIRIEYIDTKNEEVKSYELPASGIYSYAKRSNSKAMEEFDVDAEFENFKSDLRNAYASVRNLKFERTSNLQNCKYCPFKDHCGR